MLNSLLPNTEAYLSKQNLRINKDPETKVIDLSTKNYFSSIPTEQDLQKIFEKAFVINKPMDKVGGDGFWIHQDVNHSVLVAFDCMGHGRLATIMTSQYLALLDKVVKTQGERNPTLILKKIHLELKEKYADKDHMLGTGADMGVFVFDRIRKEAIYSGAKMDLYQLINRKVERLRGGRRSIGEYFHKGRDYEIIELDLKNATHFYLMSDGVTDLFGGPKDKKFGSKNLVELLQATSSLEVSKEREQIQIALNRWNGSNQQTDDILMVSIRPPFV